MPQLDSYSKTIEVLNKYDFHFKKKYGQNFLIDSDILRDIVEGAEVTEYDTVIEIGPGVGSLTQYLAEAAGRVICIELDDRLVPILHDTLSEYDNVTIINDDVLDVDFEKLFKDENITGPVKFVANLPYYITTPIILGILQRDIDFDSITVMVQREVAERMQAKPGTSEYGALTLAVQFYTDPEILFTVKPESFVPRPKVESAVITLHRKELTEEQKQIQGPLFRTIRAAFNQRRKTLVNAIYNAGISDMSKKEMEDAMWNSCITTTWRAEVLTLDDYIKLTKVLKVK
ncbi:MAG: 16S rRNA (adenine(1518)-N(6)/adenine(1519)-N(6))-dimethyltransferase RsmA [Lachnospiraceae bacterium]|uniref:Ribosomal RNA small subunit methyltransferase A n=1 Tax=Candidatus Weimeria bifida TaxID=2599074 RepID=A0A6N7J0G3_9FIRM|nr:16S rRNA (adenine(1518)-N(6)/adenine(1519)-N(6))-dimethyltransferase RsmA [Candidatus Weimeria bifida]RRF96876.1 MAG: 16S rRNA (adenine(1518)-N(6)/adenine(1519)-N(6))-dimethyltransferase RsmA [Lachnospiraceae bacterium]